VQAERKSRRKKRKYTPPHNYTTAEIRFLERKVAGRSHAEVTELFNRRFGLSFTVSRIHSTLQRYGFTNGRDTRFRPGQTSFNKGQKGIHFSRKTEFKKGNRPWNWRPVGSERINADGYAEVKIRNPNKWKTKHRIIWEKAHGKIPRGGVIIFADGNRLNMRLNNLLLVSRSELSVMNHLGLMSNKGKLTEIGKSIADVKLLIAGRKRQIKKRKKSRRGHRGKA
jgi:hypothetical protein